MKSTTWPARPRIFAALRSALTETVHGRVAKGAAWLLTGTILSRGLGILSTMVLARVLGKEVFGEFGIAQSTIQAFLVFADFGLGITATKFVAEFRTANPARAGRIISLSLAFASVLGSVIAVALFTAAPWLCVRLLNSPQLTSIIQVSSLLILFGALNGAQSGILSGLESFRTVATNNLLAAVVQCPMILIGVLTDGLRGAVWGLVAGAMFNFLIQQRSIHYETRRARIDLGLRGCLKESPVMWQFSLPAVLGGVMVMPVTWACHVLLVNQPGGYGEMGIYQAANSFPGLLGAVAATVGTPILSVLANSAHTHQQSTGRLNILLSWAVGLVLALPLMSFPEIPRLLFGPEFAGSSFVRAFVLILLFFCITCYKQGLARVLALKNLMWWGVLSNTLWAAMLLTGAYYLAPKGAAGLALAYVIAYALSTVVFVPFYARVGLVPMSTMISLEATITWLLVLVTVLLSYYEMPLLVRIAWVPIALAGCGICFRRMARSTEPSTLPPVRRFQVNTPPTATPTTTAASEPEIL